MRLLHFYVKFYIHFISILEVMCWLDVVRTYSINDNTNKKVKRTSQPGSKKQHHMPTQGCRKDRHCDPSQFCNRYERSCLTCKTEGQMCRRNKMCCRGMECAAGKCREKIQLGLEHSLCSKDRDCNYGFCCARERGQSICKPLLKEGQRCGIPEGGAQYFWSHQCPCEYGLKCKEIDKTTESLKQKYKGIIDNWNGAQNRRCVRPLHIKIT